MNAIGPWGRRMARWFHQSKGGIRDLCSFMLPSASCKEIGWDESYAGIVVHVPLGSGPPVATGPYELVLGDTCSWSHVIDVARYCQRHGLPIDVWVISGLGEHRETSWEVGRWIAGLVRAQPQARVVLLTESMDDEDRHRLKLSLKRRGVLG